LNAGRVHDLVGSVARRHLDAGDLPVAVSRVRATRRATGAYPNRCARVREV
jgi:hypothetical protein